MRREIKVVSYNPDWPRMFELEAKQLITLFGDEVVSIEHIGSTSIPGMRAKPIIDILVGARNIEVIDNFNTILCQKGYLPEGEYGIDGRRFIIKGTQFHRTHHIHIFGQGHYRLVEHVIFRDYLIAHPNVATQYAQLKMELAKKYTYDSFNYVEGKAEFIQEVNRRAMLWQGQDSLIGVMHGVA